MKVGKAQGPSGVTSNQAAGAAGVKGLFQVCESTEGEVPEQWHKSYGIPVYINVREMS